ncbi:MAG: hypothetical protein ACRDSZ_02785 [Pseudonocardiaceae bacterium]
MAWRELGPTHLIARTMDGHHRAVTACDAGDLFDAALPGPTLNSVVTTVSNAAGNSTDTPVASVPLFYITATPTTGAVELHVYSQIRFLADDACFIVGFVQGASLNSYLNTGTSSRAGTSPITCSKLSNLNWTADTFRSSLWPMVSI